MERSASSRLLIRFVAAPFLLGGGLAVVAAFGAPFSAQNPLVLGLVNVAAGVGLLLRRPVSRTAALILLALQLGGTIFLGAMVISGASPLTLMLLNHAIELGRGSDAALVVAFAAIEVAGLMILSRTGVRGAFAEHA